LQETINLLKIKPETMLKVISKVGAGYHTFEYGAEKICIINE
jgi:hypothetical protein